MPTNRRWLYDKPVSIGADIPFDAASRMLDQVIEKSAEYGPHPNMEIGVITALDTRGTKYIIAFRNNAWFIEKYEVMTND